MEGKQTGTCLLVCLSIIDVTELQQCSVPEPCVPFAASIIFGMHGGFQGARCQAPGHLGAWCAWHLGTWAPGVPGAWAPGHLGTWAPGVPGVPGTWAPGTWHLVTWAPGVPGVPGTWAPGVPPTW